MPFSSTYRVLYGDDALTPASWARSTFCEWLASKLNDAEGPYATALGVTTERPAFVLENQAIAKAMYVRTDAPPVVSLMQGPIDLRRWWKEIDGTRYEGQRIEMECTLGMGVMDRTPDDDDVGAERADDNNLAGFVPDAIEKGREELDALGIFNVSVTMDNEANVRHAQKLTFFIRTLGDWTPTL